MITYEIKTTFYDNDKFSDEKITYAVFKNEVEIDDEKNNKSSK